MLIANPIYDRVFKRLLENERIAKFFIGTLLDETVLSLSVGSQEFVYDDKASESLLGVRLFRLDFVAVIKTADGTKKILIEMQKTDHLDDLMRFRNYLAENYKREDTVDGEKTALPITTIYILNFNLPDIESACIRVAREYRDLIDGGVIRQKSPFVEKLTHDCFVVQTRRIAGRYRTRLDKVLSLFEQTDFVEADAVRDYRYQPEEDELKEMVATLHYVATDPQEKEILDNEREARRIFEASIGSERRKREQAERKIAEQAAVLAEKDAEIAELKKQLNEQNKKTSL
jgi:hypothetical protein